MLIRPYQSEDFAALYVLEERCFLPPHRFSRRYMKQLVTSESAATWVAVDAEDRLTGFAIVEWGSTASGMVAYIETLEVDAGQRKMGLGTKLLHHCIRSAREAGAHSLWLHVAEENEAARRLYAAQGFAEQGREQNYYGRDRDGLLLALLLEPEA